MPRPSKKKNQVAAALEARRKKRSRLENVSNEDGHSSNGSGCGFDINEDDSQTTSEDHRNAMLKLMELSKAWVNNDRRPSVYIGNSRTKSSRLCT